MESHEGTKQEKTTAIIAYVTIIGTIAALFMNQKKETPFISFHIRQALGLWIIFFVLGAFTSMFFNSLLISTPFYISIFALISFGLITAANGEEKPVPILGGLLQKVFAFIK
ncbi:hypothetical protein GCM10022393_14860 [Aquimarina addita]|uniref:DUF4870 domain-containing protein n=1 Tax=Aquimarina addita TaxID=870485 RepID=A0ABP7XFT3_9FLAO